MKEIFLHHLWREKRLPFPQLKLVSGEPIVIKDVGEYNQNKAGPDFEMASISLDKVTLIGSVEMHINSSDWYKHKHHLDSNYNNVILHVVHKHDKEIVQNGRTLPTLELSQYLSNYLGLAEATEIPCLPKIDYSNALLLESMKSKAWYLRTVKRMESWFGSEGIPPKEALFRTLLSGMGTGINSSSFFLLAQKSSYAEIEGLSSLGVFNFLRVKSMGIPDLIWHYKGVRPANFPSKRLMEFSELINKKEWDLIFDLPFQEGWEVCKNIFNSMNFSSFWKTHLLINAMIPFWLKTSYNQSEIWGEIEFKLTQLPPEKNAITKKWKSSEVRNKNAFDSQGLLALYRYYCSQKKCLTCEVGCKLMKE